MKRMHLVLILLFSTMLCQIQAQRNIILDADTGNEVDDLYAIVRAVLEPSWSITALNATQWQPSQWAVEHTMEESHRLNLWLLGYLDTDRKILTRRGGVDRMFDWGDKAQHSAAAYEIIKQAKSQKDGEKITVVALGALTNVASAIFIEPSIVDKLSVYWLGSTYDFENGILRTMDFNCMMDPQALEIIFQSEVELHVIPVSLASQMQKSYQVTKEKLEGHELGRFLIDRWHNHLDGGRNERVIWDLGLIEAMIHPEWAEEVQITLPKERGGRQVNYYKSIDADKMWDDFFEVYQRWVASQ